MAPPADMGQLTGTVFAEFAPLYEAAYNRGVSPYEVDRMEIWQLASAMGLHSEIKSAASTPTRHLTGEALLRARVAAHERGEAPPEAAPMDSAALAPVLDYGQGVIGRAS